MITTGVVTSSARCAHAIVMNKYTNKHITLCSLNWERGKLMLTMRRTLQLLAIVLLLCHAALAAPSEKWSERQANEWYAKQPFLVGSNYNPANAINELEMWQADTFDPQRIDLELGWAEDLGMNTMRVFLHDLLWKQDPEGFKRRIATFLDICAKHKIRPMLVLFDSCWDPYP